MTKAVLPGLWSTLGGGGHGCCSVIAPCLLPLLDNIVTSSAAVDHGFIMNFMERLGQA